MKSKIHEFQENKFLQTSKKSIIYLGIALVTFSNVISALGQQSSLKEDGLTQMVQSSASLDRNTNSNHSIERKNSNKGRNPESIDPGTIVVCTYQKTMEEIIVENNQIIESTISREQSTEKNIAEDNQIDISIEASPVSNEKAMEERILQDSQIIENSVKTEQKYKC